LRLLIFKGFSADTRYAFLVLKMVIALKTAALKEVKSALFFPAIS